MTSKRFSHITNLTALRRAVALSPDDTDRILRAAIVDALPDQYRKVYDWISFQYTPVTSVMVMRAWDLKPNHASTLLKELHDFGLLTRTRESDTYGQVYYYTVAN